MKSFEQRFFLRCRDLVRSAVPTFAAKAFLLCFAGARSRAKPQAKALINQADLFLRRLSDGVVLPSVGIHRTS